jgi:hypothetical protein
VKFNKDFKEAISRLPSKEKDKLILRLLKKDLMLANGLLFELVNPQTVDERRAIIEKRIINQTKRFYENYYSPGELMMDLRYIPRTGCELVVVRKYSGGYQ